MLDAPPPPLQIAAHPKRPPCVCRLEWGQGGGVQRGGAACGRHAWRPAAASAPLTCSTLMRVTSRRQPLAPMGWPRATAPPCMFTLLSASPSSWRLTISTTEKASLISHASMSARLRLARATAFGAARAGVVVNLGAGARWRACCAYRNRGHSALLCPNGTRPLHTHALGHAREQHHPAAAPRLSGHASQHPTQPQAQKSSPAPLWLLVGVRLAPHDRQDGQVKLLGRAVAGQHERGGAVGEG